MTGPYTVHNADGEVVAGDAVVDSMMRSAADKAGGWVEDTDGTVVYDSRIGDA